MYDRQTTTLTQRDYSYVSAVGKHTHTYMVRIEAEIKDYSQISPPADN